MLLYIRGGRLKIFFLSTIVEKMASTWREKTAHIEKYQSIGEPPPTWNCFIHSPMPPPPPERQLFPPLPAPIMISTHLISFV